MPDQLHLDIIEEILARSQVKDLIRCKSVCKSWNSLISSPPFVKSHLNYNHKKKADNNEIGDTRVDLIINIYRDPVYHLVGSSNGLVCISLVSGEFFVFNPSTREVKELRNPPQEYTYHCIKVSGFGYDSSIDDYKVVIGFSTKCWNKFSFKVLTLKSNIWRSVAATEEVCGNYYYNYGTLCNGAIHWLLYDQNYRQVIASFDLSKEVIKEIPAPDQCDLFKDEYALGTIKDCLCIIPYRGIHFKKTKEIGIWVMKNYNVQESWERWLQPPGYDGQKTIPSYIPHMYKLYGHYHIWMLEEGTVAAVLVHSLERPGENEHIKLFTISECNYNFNVPVFVKSLVSPHGMGDDDSCNGGRLEGKGNTSSSSDHHHTKPCITWQECHTICNKFQRFAKISQDQKASLKKKVKENSKKPLRTKHKVRGKTNPYVIEDEEGTDMSGDDYDGILDHNLELVQRRTYTFKDFLSELKEDSPTL